MRSIYWIGCNFLQITMIASFEDDFLKMVVTEKMCYPDDKHEKLFVLSEVFTPSVKRCTSYQSAGLRYRMEEEKV